MSRDSRHRVVFTPSGRSATVADGANLLEASRQALEPMQAECGGRGACGKCLALVVEGEVPEYRVIHRVDGLPQVLACQTAVHGPLTLRSLGEMELPKLISGERALGVAPLTDWAPWPLFLEPGAELRSAADLGVAVDIGTTTIRLLLIRLADAVVVGEAGAYNPQIAWGADVISRIIAAGKGQLAELSRLVRQALLEMIHGAAEQAGLDVGRITAYAVAGNLTMMHLLLGLDPSGIRQVPSQPSTLAFQPVEASVLGWPGQSGSRVHTLPAAGGWVGGDIVSGIVRAGFSRQREGLSLYVDLGTNGEIAVGGADFAMACACSAGPAFEGSGIRCGMRADRGAIDGACIDVDQESLLLSTIGGGAVRGICGSGLIALTDALFRSGWIDRSARFTEKLPRTHSITGKFGKALRLTPRGQVSLWERDLASLLRAKAAIFSGIRTLLKMLDIGAGNLDRIVVSGNFGRYLNLPAAAGIGLLPELPPDRYAYVDNGSLEGAALSLLSREFAAEIETYLRKITYIDLSDSPGYMDEFIAATFLPHTDPNLLRQ